MRTLDRKLLRNLGSMRGQLFAIVLIIACGIASFVTVLTAYRGLTSTRDAYYARYRMADLFATVKRAPRAALDDLARLPGVRRAEGRIVFDVTLDVPDLSRPASGRVVSVPDRRTAILNDLHLTRGRWFEGDGTGQVIVADRFAQVHGLEVGDTVSVLMNNKKEALRIVARALSPEFTYLIRGAGDVLPDPESFTVLWVSETFAEAVFDFDGACNDFVATLDPGASLEDVIAAFDRRLDRHGAIGAYGRRDQLSNRFLSDEIKGLQGSATMTPTIFLAVAAFTLHMLLARVVATQRTQIALFRAFGYTTGELVRHYLKLALGIGILGAAVGSGMGIWFGRQVAAIYGEFYSFPILDFPVDPVAIVGGTLAALVFASLGAIGALRAVVRLLPAEALQPEAPKAFGRTFLERWPLFARLPFPARMILRHIARSRVRAAITVGGVALSASILLLAFFSWGATEGLLDHQFRLSDRQDVRVAFHEERGRGALYELGRLPGVRVAEPELAVPVRLVHGNRSRRTGIAGLAPGSTLHALLDENLRHVQPPREGLLLSRKLAELLDVRPGDDVEVRVLNGRKPVLEVPVESVVDEQLGTAAYADLHRLSRWVGEEYALTGARLSVTDPRRLGEALKEIPSVAAVDFKGHTVASFRETLARSQRIFGTVLILFAGAITFGVVYNTARISLAERARELGTLSVLGFTDTEVRRVLEGESWLLAALALLPGLGLGALFSWLLTRVYDTELFRFPFVLRRDSILQTVALVLLFTLLANLLVRRRLRTLDMVDILKARE
ncbi:MAG TPA: ABC transporter permease [Planctomycetota bacterium]|nr:ABC transporter permease [Planctomycetota bacterium]